MNEELYAVSRLVKWKGHRCYQHVYFDSLRAELESKKLDHMLLCCYDELISGSPAAAHERYYRDFFTIYEAAADSLKCSHGWQNISTVFSISSDNKAKPGNAANSDTIHRQGTPPCHVVMHRKEEGSL